MRTHGATRLLALILSLRFVARIQTSLNSCDRSWRQNSVAATLIFTCHMRQFVAATCGSDMARQFVAWCVSAFNLFSDIPLHKPSFQASSSHYTTNTKLYYWQILIFGKISLHFLWNSVSEITCLCSVPVPSIIWLLCVYYSTCTCTHVHCSMYLLLIIF